MHRIDSDLHNTTIVLMSFRSQGGSMETRTSILPLNKDSVILLRRFYYRQGCSQWLVWTSGQATADPSSALVYAPCHLRIRPLSFGIRPSSCLHLLRLLVGGTWLAHKSRQALEVRKFVLGGCAISYRYDLLMTDADDLTTASKHADDKEQFKYCRLHSTASGLSSAMRHNLNLRAGNGRARDTI